MTAREQLARLEEQRSTLQRRLDRGGGVLARVGIGSDTGRLHSSLADIETQVKKLNEHLEALGPRIEAAKTKADFLAAEHQGRLAGYLNEPENARRLFDSNWAADAGRGSSRRRASAGWTPGWPGSKSADC